MKEPVCDAKVRRSGGKLEFDQEPQSPNTRDSALPNYQFSLDGGLGFLEGRENHKDLIHPSVLHQRPDPVMYCHQYQAAPGIDAGNVRVDNDPHACRIDVRNLAEIEDHDFRRLVSSHRIPQGRRSGVSYWAFELEDSFTLLDTLCLRDGKLFLPHIFAA